MMTLLYMHSRKGFYHAIASYFSYGTMALLQPIFSCRSSSGTGMVEFFSLLQH